MKNNAATTESIYMGADIKFVRHLPSQISSSQSASSWQNLIATAEWSPDAQVKSLPAHSWHGGKIYLYLSQNMFASSKM